MKHKILLLMVVLLLLSGCSCKTETEVIYADHFVLAEKQGFDEIYVDTETNVMYWFHHVPGVGISMTVVLNEDGTPKLWDGELPKDGE